MTRSRHPTNDDRTSRIGRRAFLTGLGALGAASLGAKTVRGGVETETRPSRSQSSESPFPGTDELEAYVDEVMADRIGTTTPGAIVAIVKGDTPILTGGYGSMNVDTGNSVSADEAVFRIGSVGKLVTFTAVMQGVERGILDLDTDVNTYLEDSAVTVPDTYENPVTLRHLGTHTAGFESTLDPDIVTDRDDIDALEAVLASQQRSRIRPPGERVGYSNYGAALAGHIVAEAHDTSFEEYVQSEIFEPLGMTHSTFAQPVPDDQPGNLASPHSRDGESFTVVDDVYINMRSAGSMSATATDMASFMSAHLGAGAVGDSRILDAETAETMHDRHHIRHPAVTNWRYGFYEYGDPSAGLIAHSGATINFASQLLLAPVHDVGIFVGYNSNPSEPPAAVVDEIVAQYDLQPAPSPPSPTQRPGGQERAKRAAGEYSVTYLPQHGPLQVADLLEHVTVKPAADGGLRTTTLDGDRRQWVETEPYVYEEVGGHDTLAFEVRHGDVTVMNMSSEQTGVYKPVSPHDKQHVTGAVLGTSLAGFTLSLVGRGGNIAKNRMTKWRCEDNRITEESE